MAEVMTPELTTALNLLGVGMITVFVVLTLVVGVGSLLIRMVNMMPNREPQLDHGSPAIQAATIAAITAAVELATEGKGTITNIEKID